MKDQRVRKDVGQGILLPAKSGQQSLWTPRRPSWWPSTAERCGTSTMNFFLPCQDTALEKAERCAHSGAGPLPTLL